MPASNKTRLNLHELDSQKKHASSFQVLSPTHNSGDKNLYDIFLLDRRKISQVLSPSHGRGDKNLHDIFLFDKRKISQVLMFEGALAGEHHRHRRICLVARLDHLKVAH